MINLSDERFSEDELNALEAWTALENFGESFQTKRDRPNVLTVEDIETVQKQAYDEAFQQGKQEGLVQGREQGHTEGKEAGLQQGLQEGREQGYKDKVHLIKEQAEQLIRLLEALNEPFQRLDEQVEEALVTLAIGIAKQLLRREIKTDPGQVVAVVKEAVKALPLASQKVSLTLHPEDAELVRSALVLDEMSPPWSLLEDPLMTRGGCVVDSGASHVDASIEKRLSAIVTNLWGGQRKSDSVDDSAD